MASYRKPLSLLKPGLSVAVSVNAKREVKVHQDSENIMSSITITPPGSPPGALADDQQTHDPRSHEHQIQDQKLREANLLTPNASPTHETDAYSVVKASCIYHATPVVKSPPHIKGYSLPPARSQSDSTPRPAVPTKFQMSRKSQSPGIVDEAIIELFRKIDTNFRSVSPQVPTQRQAVVDRIPIVLPAGLEAYEKETNKGVVAKPCPSCWQLPGPVYDMDCEDSCHRPSTPPNLTVNDYRSAMEDVCKYDMPTLVRARELADLAMWSKRAEYSRKSFLQSILDATSDVMDSDECDESGYDTPDESFAIQSPALEARLRRRMKKAKRRKKVENDACSKHTSQHNDSELSAVPTDDLTPRIMVAANKNGSTDMRVPDVKIHTYIPTDHNSYCAPAKSPKSASHVEHGMDGIVVVKEPNGRLNTTVPGSLPTDSTTPRKILSQVGQRKRTCVPSPNLSSNIKRSKRSLNGKEETDSDPMSRAMLLEKKEKHKQSERIRRNKSSLLIKSLQSYIAVTCGKSYFKCKNRSENPSKQATVETTVARFWELDGTNNNALVSLNATFTSAVDVLKGLQRRSQSGDHFRNFTQALKAEAEGLKAQISEHLQHAQAYGK